MKRYSKHKRLSVIVFHSLCIVGLLLTMSPLHESITQAATASSEGTSSEITYMVQNGDTLWNIAQSYKVEVQELMRSNRLDSDMISVGQELIIPHYPVESERYIVQKGDNLWKIAQKYEIDIQELKHVNSLQSNVLQIGQVLNIPEDDDQNRQNEQKGNDSFKEQKATANTSRKNAEKRWTTALNVLGQDDNIQAFNEQHPMWQPKYQSSTQKLDTPNCWWLYGISKDTRIQSDLICSQFKMKRNNINRAEEMYETETDQSVHVTVQGVHAEAKKTVESSTSTRREKSTRPLSNDDYEWLAKIIEAEAESEPYLGKVAVGSVVMNRVAADSFPDSVKEVIFQKTKKVYQFTPVGNGRIYRVTPSKDAYKAAQAALDGEDPTDGALYFYNPTISSDRWIRTRTVVTTIGQHSFAY